MRQLAQKLNVTPRWGKRTAIIYELSPMASAIGDVLCNTETEEFQKYGAMLLKDIETEVGSLYEIKDNEGNIGKIRHVIWSDIIVCPHCNQELMYAEVALKKSPLQFISKCKCTKCKSEIEISKAEKAYTQIYDPVLKKSIPAKKRIPYKIYGITGKNKWERYATNKDIELYSKITKKIDFGNVPIYKIKWGELYRKGYHYGIDYLHQMYTLRNAFVISKAINKIHQYPAKIQKALKVFLLSYNQSHATLMSRVVAKTGEKDFIVTGAQPGVMYVSSLPVEKNIILGLRRKLSTFIEAIQTLSKSESEVEFVTGSCLSTKISKKTIDYIFTDPPFGNYIPYSEINEINEAWYGDLTDKTDEVVINSSQDKTCIIYKKLMTKAFNEMHNALKDNGECTVVFHSAKAAVWRAILEAIEESNFSVIKTGLLDKIQSSFKQINSKVIVKGDELLLIRKNAQRISNVEWDGKGAEEEEIIQQAIANNSNPETAYGDYIRECINRSIIISADASEFYKKWKKRKH